MHKKKFMVRSLFVVIALIPAFLASFVPVDGAAEPTRSTTTVEPLSSMGASEASAPVVLCTQDSAPVVISVTTSEVVTMQVGDATASGVKAVDAPQASSDELPAAGMGSEEITVSSSPVLSMTRPIAVMVENEPPARPQSGLYAAKVLFEIQAEEVTRFMGIYYDLTQSCEIGPIRSARHYFVDISTMFDAVYVHVGGSPMGLAEIAERKINNINAIKGDRGFYRSTDRRIPHNLYAKLPNLKKEMERKKYRTETDKRMPFEFAETKLTSTQLLEKGVQGAAVKSVQVPYSRGYRVGYEFDAGANRFGRLYNDRPFKDLRNSTQVTADNLVLMRCNMYIIDEQMRHEMDLYEGGTCEIFIGGHHVSGSWDRDRVSGVFKYYDSGLNDVKFNPGNVIVHIIAPDQPVIIDGQTFVCEAKRGYGKVKNGGGKKDSRKKATTAPEEPEDDGGPPF